MSTLGTVGETAGHETATWYYVGSFGQLGPLTLDQLEELVDGGVIESETYVWNAGMPTWLPAKQVPQLAGSLDRRMPYAEPPPVPGSVSRPPTPTVVPPSVTAPRGISGATPMRLGSSRDLTATYAAYASPYALPSDQSATTAGILNIILPGVGRLYLGYYALGLIQILATLATCGIAHIWSIVDGVMMLTGSIKVDGYGRILKL